MELLKTDAVLPVPPEVGKCPYCGGKVFVQFDQWSENDDLTWSASDLAVTCETEPDIDSDEFEEWLESHSEMPYVYMLPLEMRLMKWINERYRFDLSE